jgi:hypothetical protein
MPQLEYFTVAGIEYLIELNLTVTVPKTWVKVNSTKAKNRFHPPEVLQAVRNLALAREQHSAACTAAWRYFLLKCAHSYGMLHIVREHSRTFREHSGNTRGF